MRPTNVVQQYVHLEIEVSASSTLHSTRGATGVGWGWGAIGLNVVGWGGIEWDGVGWSVQVGGWVVGDGVGGWGGVEVGGVELSAWGHT